MAYLSELNTKKQYSARIQKTRRLTPENTEEVREIVLMVENPEFQCTVDQSFGVLVRDQGEFGHGYHHRLYSVADLPVKKAGKTQITMLVKRCSYVDELNGEKYEGVASNYLCDRKEGDHITITGPFELPFKVPSDPTANLILVGMGTGIAPFRAFIKHLYREEGGWLGKVRLFYGARTGMEMLYLNDQDGDLTNYYDKATFQAFKAVSPRPHWADPIRLDETLEAQAVELREMLNQSNTYLYIAGYSLVRENLNKAFAKILGSTEIWENRKAELIAGKKWAEIIY